MSQFFISCKESRIENNRSFYGCFYLGPFEPSQSITIANALRRTLLSELYGLGIISVEIEGATHEYSSLPGVRDSVLDILLNLKEIVLKKTIKNFKPQIGYLRARGPGVVRASHLRLPPFIQCVDPDQYIATLADNGFLNMKFIIQYGNKWLSPFNSLSSAYNQRTDNKEKEETNKSKKTSDYNSGFNLHLKKRRLILKKLKQIGIASSNSYINMFARSAIYLSKYTKKRNTPLVVYPLRGTPSPPYSPYGGTQTKGVSGEEGITPLQKKIGAVTPLYPKDSPLPPRRGDRGGPAPKARGLNVAVTISKKYPAINLKNGPTVKKLSKSIEKEILEQKVLASTSKNSLAHKKTKKYNFRSKGKTPKGQACVSARCPGLRPGIRATDDLAKLNHLVALKRSKGASPKNKKPIFFNANPLTIDAVFNPINKVNYIIEINDFKTATSKMQTSFETSELYEMLKSTQSTNILADFLSPAAVEKDLKNYMQSQLIADQRITSSLIQSTKGIAQAELENILEIKREINAFKKDTTKHNITLEVWTNGSIHPRDALYEGFKNLIKLFAKLKKINTLWFPYPTLPLKGVGNYLGYKEGDILCGSKEPPCPKKDPPGSPQLPRGGKVKTLLKKIKMGELTSTLLQDLLPLNETSFLSTYVAPKLKNYYLNNESLSVVLKSPVLKSPVLKRQTEPILIPSTTAQESTGESALSPGDKGTNKLNKFSFISSCGSLKDPTAKKKFGSGEPPPQADIGILNLSLRSYTCLKRLKINTIEELLALSKNNLSNLKKLGKASVEEIEKSLEKIGLNLFV